MIYYNDKNNDNNADCNNNSNSNMRIGNSRKMLERFVNSKLPPHFVSSLEAVSPIHKVEP